jgi:hypothetical protein
MNEKDDEAIAEAGRVASEALERSLMKAVGSVEAELSRVVRAGEADIARLAGSIVEILARISAAQSEGPTNTVDSGGAGDTALSLNQIAAAVARAARRGARFS